MWRMIDDEKALRNAIAHDIRSPPVSYTHLEEQQKIMDEKINEYEKQGYSAKEAKKRAEKYVAIPDTSEHQLGPVSYTHLDVYKRQ